MQALTFWKTVVADESNVLERVIGWLARERVRYCVVGGQAVNAYAEPVVSLDLDLAIAPIDVARVERLSAEGLSVRSFAHSVNVSAPHSSLRIQFQTDPRYASFPERAQRCQVLGLELPVAALEDVLDGKVWAASDESRRRSKRQKDLADIARLLEGYPELRDRVPAELLAKLI